jgi:hypothetical protein
VRKSKIALKIVIGRTRNMLFVMFKTEAIQMPPKATWLNPSPINENRLRTSVIPKSEEQREIKTPTIKAYRTNEKLKYIARV